MDISELKGSVDHSQNLSFEHTSKKLWSDVFLLYKYALVSEERKKIQNMGDPCSRCVRGKACI